MSKDLRISCAIVDDIDFMPMHEQVTVVDIKSTDSVAGLIKAVIEDEPTLKQYRAVNFRVLRILRPVPADPDVDGSEISNQHGKGEPLSLEPILQRLRERNKQAETTELANEYVKVLSISHDVQQYFKHEERQLVSAIMVRLSTTSESSGCT